MDKGEYKECELYPAGMQNLVGICYINAPMTVCYWPPREGRSNSTEGRDYTEEEALAECKGEYSSGEEEWEG